MTLPPCPHTHVSPWTASSSFCPGAQGCPPTQVLPPFWLRASVEGIPCTSRVVEPHNEGGRQDAPPGSSGPGSASQGHPPPCPMDPAKPPPLALRRVPWSQECPSPTGGVASCSAAQDLPFADYLLRVLRTMGRGWRGSRRKQPGWFCNHLKVSPFLMVNLKSVESFR